MKKKEMAALFDELGEYALETKIKPVGKQSDRDSKKLVEIALLASASTFAFCSGIAEGSVSMPLSGKQERYHALARILQLGVRHGIEGREMMERRGNDGHAAGRPAERRKCRREQGGCRKAVYSFGHGKVMHGNECGKRCGKEREGNGNDE